MTLSFHNPDAVADLDWATPKQVEAYRAFLTHGGVSGAARALGLHRTSVQYRLRDLKAAAAERGRHDIAAQLGTTASPKQAPNVGAVQRFLLTGAQDDTDLHMGFWENLLAYSKVVGAAVMVGPFTYNKAVFSDHETRTGAFRPEVQPYLHYEKVDLGPIVFCAEMNTLPTANDPLSGLEPYTGQKWGVFPHAKIALVTVPTLVGRPPKQIMTTGCVTIENYIQKKAGLKAQFHHCIGATIVEIDDAGRVFCRQINATADGSFQDLDVIVRRGAVTRGNRVEAIGWGDIHKPKLDPIVADAAWGLDLATGKTDPDGSMIDTLRPRYQFFHDLLDFTARNHHRIKDHRFRFAMVTRGTDSVQEEVAITAKFLRASERDFCESVIVYSNHDDALGRWLDTADFREDAVNARFFLRCTTARYDAIDRGEPRFNIFREALSWADERDLAGITFVDDDESFLICQASGGVECAMHGHLGINGARGNAKAFTKTSVKINRGHDHSPSIHGGVFTAGLSGLMDQGYNRGLSGWMHSHIVTYPSGKRSLVTMIDGKWRA